jgi:hypothetical protein
MLLATRRKCCERPSRAMLHTKGRFTSSAPVGTPTQAAGGASWHALQEYSVLDVPPATCRSQAHAGGPRGWPAATRSEKCKARQAHAHTHTSRLCDSPSPHQALGSSVATAATCLPATWHLATSAFEAATAKQPAPGPWARRSVHQPCWNFVTILQYPSIETDPRASCTCIMHSVSLQKGGQFAIEFIILVLALRVAVEACMWLVAVLSCGAVLRCGCLDQLSYFLFELACL